LDKGRTLWGILDGLYYAKWMQIGSQEVFSEGKMVRSPAYRGQVPSARSLMVQRDSPSRVETFTGMYLSDSLKPFTPESIFSAHS